MGPFSMIVTCLPRYQLTVRLIATAYNIFVGLLITPGFISQGRFTPGTFWTWQTNRLTTFTATMGMIARGHGGATNGWTNASMSIAACLAKFDVTVIEIANLADGRKTGLAHQSYFTGGHADLGKITFLGKQLGRSTSGTHQLASAPIADFNIMDQSTHRDIRNRERVPRSDLGSRASHNRVVDLEIHRCDNITLLTVCVMQ